MRKRIPDAYLDLADCLPVAALTTVMPNGQPQTTVVWCNFDGTHVLVNTMRGFRKEKNMRLNPKVTLLCYDPRQPLRSLEVRGRVGERPRPGRWNTWMPSVSSIRARPPTLGAACRLNSRKRRGP